MVIVRVISGRAAHSSLLLLTQDPIPSFPPTRTPMQWHKNGYLPIWQPAVGKPAAQNQVQERDGIQQLPMRWVHPFSDPFCPSPTPNPIWFRPLPGPIPSLPWIFMLQETVGEPMKTLAGRQQHLQQSASVANPHQWQLVSLGLGFQLCIFNKSLKKNPMFKI